jgi:hypothetical protein
VLSQPAELPRTSPQTIPNAPLVTSARPGRSRPVSGPTLSLMRLRESTIAASPIGTFGQKIHGHEMPSTAAPPTSGPSTMPRPVIAPNVPRAFARRSGGKAALSRASPSGIISAAPVPCAARAAISTPVPPARAHAADAAVKSPSPATKKRLRP